MRFLKNAAAEGVFCDIPNNSILTLGKVLRIIVSDEGFA
jgi:hypothetical protein